MDDAVHVPYFDVAIIGSGFGGSTLGAILARQGLRVVIFEAGSHPRFVIGESLILETSETMRTLAELYDVPELAYFSSENYVRYIGGAHGVKRHFSYLHHTDGAPHRPEHTLQAVIPRFPHGHELHLYRQETDYFLTVCAIRYGATVLQNTPVAGVETDADGVTITTAESAGGARYRAGFLVDAGGFRSVVAQQEGLRDPDLRTHSRAIFTHMVDVPDIQAAGVMPAKPALPFPISQGTLHHVFAGGWLWVIPFDNHPNAVNPLCSVGLMLDPRVHPLQEDLSPAAEFDALVARFPTVAAHLQGGKPVRSWVRTGRIQYASTRIVGDRWALLGHAAGFVDPLYSKGLYITLASVSLLADLLLRAFREDIFSREHFLPLEHSTLAYLRSNDRLVANSYKSWGDYALWSAYSVLWLLGAYTEYVKLLSIRVDSTRRGRVDPDAYYSRLQELKLVGGGFEEFDALADQVDGLVEAVDMTDPAAVAAAVAQIKALFAGVDWIPEPFQAVLAGKHYLPKQKVRLDLFDRDQGFMGHDGFRRHFFGAHSMTDVVTAAVRDFLRYSRWALAVRHRLNRG